jgi:hypothetical protein
MFKIIFFLVCECKVEGIFHYASGEGHVKALTRGIFQVLNLRLANIRNAVNKAWCHHGYQ